MTDKVENLMLQSNGNGGYDAFLIEYGFTKEQYDFLTETTISNLSTKYTPIDFDTSLFNNGELGKWVSEYFCLEVWTYEYGYNSSHGYLHGAGCDNTCGSWVNTSSDCGYIYYNDDPGGGDTTSPGDGSGTGDGGGGGSSGSTSGTSGTGYDPTDPNNHGGNPPVLGAPAVEENANYLQHQKNCDELHKFSTSPYAQDEFDNLEGELSASKEKGYVIKANPAFPYFTTLYVESDGDCDEISMPNNNILIYAFMHTHPSGCGGGTQPMFFEGDLNVLYTMTQTFNPNVVPGLVFDISMFAVYMTVDNYVYAIKVDDIGKLAVIGDIYSNPFKKADFKRKFKRAYDKSSNNTNPTQNELAKAFLEFITETYDLGISLYRSAHSDINYNPNRPPDNQNSNWKRLTLDTNNNLDFSQGCN